MSYHGEWSRNFLWTFTYLLNIKINIQIVNHLTLMRMMVQSFLHYNEHSFAPSSSSSRASNNKLGNEQGYLWETRVSQTHSFWEARVGNYILWPSIGTKQLQCMTLVTAKKKPKKKYSSNISLQSYIVFGIKSSVSN